MSYYELWTWDKYTNELRELFTMILYHNIIPHNIDYQYYLDNIQSDLTINIKIILQFININCNNIQKIFDDFLFMDDITIISPIYLLYNLFLYHNTSKKPLTYYNIISNYNNMKYIFQKIFKEFKKCGASFDINNLLSKLNFIDEKSYYINTINFTLEVEKSKIIALIIDLISEYFLINEDLIFEDFKNITPKVFDNNDETNQNYTYRDHLLKNIKAHSKFLQKDIINPIIHNNIIFDNWNHFFYIINNISFHPFYKNTLNDGFYDIIKYLIEDKNLNVQEGFDKFILTFSNLANKNQLLNDHKFSFEMMDNKNILLYLRNLYQKIINLFKSKNAKPNINPIFEKISLIHNDDDIINSSDDKLLDVQLMIDDKFVGDYDFTHYQNRAVLLDVIYETYINDWHEWNEIVSQINIFNMNDNNDYKFLYNIIGDYYRYDLISDIKKYGEWEKISDIQYPKIIIKFGGDFTYKNLRYMRLKYYSEFLKSL